MNENINVAWTRINGKFGWFICDDYGRKLVGPVETFSTLLEASFDMMKRAEEFHSKLATD